MTAIRYFEDIGQTVLRAWSRHDFAPQALPEIAYETLTAAPPAQHVTIDDLIEWVAETDSLPPQPNLSTHFGQPPLTVFSHERFYIEALFWITATTSIHQHGFSGAFHVLAGSSLQTRYGFELRERACDSLLLGDLTLHDVKVLRRGDTEPIVGGNTLIHSVFHLDAPSVTVVVRTHSDPGSRPQYSYLRPGLAFDPEFQDPLTTRRVQMLALLQKLKSPRYGAFAAAALASADVWGTFRLLQRVRQDAAFLGVSYQDLLAQAERRQGARVHNLDAAIREEERVTRLMARRQKVFDPEHRFFLALVLNLPDRFAIMRAIQAAFPDGDPHERLRRWTAACRLSGMWDPAMSAVLEPAEA